MHPGRTTLMMSGVLCAGLLLSAGSSAAMPWSAAAGSIGVGESSLIVPVQHWHHHHHRGYGYGVGAGIAAGAIIGGIIASEGARRADSDAVAYCARRFRSYDPQSMTYLGRDGYRHRCP